MHNKTIETQKRGKTAMQIKITVDIENSDILKFFELFKKDLATVAKNTTVETVAEPLKNDSADFSKEQPQKKAQKKQPKNDCADFSGVQQENHRQKKNQIILLIIPWRMILTLMQNRLIKRFSLLKRCL